MKFRFLLLISLIFTTLSPISAQTTKRDSGTFTFNFPSTMSPDEAEQEAVTRAEIKLIEQNFGTDLQMDTFTRIENSSKQSSIDMLQLAQSHIRGEWVETISKKVTRSWDDQKGMWAVTVAITGVMRQQKNSQSAPEFVAKTLNGPDVHAATEIFKDGDQLYLYFKSPVDGYLAVYIWDMVGDTLRLVPYSCLSEQKINARQEYIFFSIDYKHNSEHLNLNNIPEIVLSCTEDVEYETVYVIFSPHHFTTPMDKLIPEIGIPTIDHNTFTKWYNKSKREDDGFYVKPIQISINK